MIPDTGKNNPETNMAIETNARLLNRFFSDLADRIGPGTICVFFHGCSPSFFRRHDGISTDYTLRSFHLLTA